MLTQNTVKKLEHSFGNVEGGTNNAAIKKDVWLLDLLRNPISLILSFDESGPKFVQCSYILLLLFLLFLQGNVGRNCLFQLSWLL